MIYYSYKILLYKIKGIYILNKLCFHPGKICLWTLIANRKLDQMDEILYVGSKTLIDDKSIQKIKHRIKFTNATFSKK